MSQPPRPEFTLIQGGRARNWRFGNLQLQIAVAHEPPFFPDFELIEEDTWRVIGAGRQFHEVKEHPVRLMTGLIDQAELEPGTCLRRARRIFLVIYNIDEEPVCRPEWIESALACALRSVDRQCGNTLCMAPPGMQHGQYALPGSLEILARILHSAQCAHLERIWLQLPRADLDPAAELLEALCKAGPAADPA